MTSEMRYLHCRFCDFKTPAWRTLKTTGEKRSGMITLKNHIEDCHYERFVEIYRPQEEDYCELT